MNTMLVLGIETSCDETAIAILEEKNGEILVLSNIISSQIALHAVWGGVVPNLAAREHLKNIIPVLKSALQEANKQIEDIDLIAVTHGPGLIPALLIGTNFAKTLAYLYNKPLLGIHHIEGHIYANFICDKISVNSKLPISNIKSMPDDLISNDKETSKNTDSKKLTKLPAKSANIKFPILSLVVSGGHTQLILMSDHFKYEIIGETQDDAVGEAFDKVARILDLGYPGGPAIATQAANFNSSVTANGRPVSNDKKHNLPRPMLHSKDFNFSFSGLKTAVLYKVKNYRKENNLEDKNPLPESFVQEMAYEFQEAATDVLVKKTIQAAILHNSQTIFIAGGVSANDNLREKMNLAIKKNLPHVQFQSQVSNYSTDNATMISVAAIYRWQKMTSAEKALTLNNWKVLTTTAQLKL
ncbi:MAG: tRNA (adenosine(37)-N6)-threonylcarbamoyltransferase complex transferase subunit TsaD [Candidatus Moraniibacteriota bacterium]